MARRGNTRGKGNLTPMMQQYHDVRKGLPKNTVLLFRLGDFYEMFLEDARVGAPILGITLTQRHGMPMAGIPYHAADNYIGKLLAAGKKVAICDQMEAPQPGKIVKRALTRILSPGTILEDHQIEANRNHYLLALDFPAGATRRDPLPALHAAWLDLTTGDFHIASASDPDDLLPVFAGIDPREIVVPEWGLRQWQNEDQLHTWHENFTRFCNGRPVNELPDYHFEQPSGFQSVIQTLGVLNLDGFGVSANHPALGPAGALIHYATESLCAPPKNLRRVSEYQPARTLLIDPSSLRNLEVFRSASGGRDGSLMDAMDVTVTAAGSRLLEEYLSNPPLEVAVLNHRQGCVGEFLQAPAYGSELQEYLKCVRDVTRILGRLENRIRNPRELGGIRDTLYQLPMIIQVLEQFEQPIAGTPEAPLTALSARLTDFPKARELLEKSLEAELPNNLLEGDYIRSGYDADLDRLRTLTRDNKHWISQFESNEQKRTGIKNLRIRFNNAFGYFIEVTKSNLALVPPDYTRKRTMTNAERYTTEALKSKEEEIRGARERSIRREEELFRGLVDHILGEEEPLRETARVLAEIDLFLGWSKLAREWDYCRPDLRDDAVLEIEGGRHPVVEQMMRKEQYGLAGTRKFVPNDTRLDSVKHQIGIITGPNMAGKSTYIRQVALITMMAQVGSWVPANRCRVGLVDRIFSRVGANDELTRGNSTFMVEMNETANILNNATPRSLVILDEIGRGTSTYDGLAIAWSVVEHLHGATDNGPRTLFATHYHELTQMARELSRVENFCVAVKEWNDEIVFVRQVIPGLSDRSYGIQVARLAGLPSSVIERAKKILEKLEADDSSHNLIRRRMKKMGDSDNTSSQEGQMELF